MATKKWAHLRGQVPKHDKQPTERRTKMNAAKDDIKKEGHNIRELGEQYARHRAKKDELETELSAQQLHIDVYEELILELMEDLDLESVTTSNATLSRTPAPLPQIVDKDALKEWIAKEGMNDLLTVNYQTLRGLVSERLLDGAALPDGVDLLMNETIRRRKS